VTARLFFALWPPAETARALAEWARQAAGEARGKPVRADQIHLTLAFLGDADGARAIDAARRVRGEAFELPIDIARYWKHNQIVWAGPESVPAALAQLVKDLQFELYRAEFILERRPFAAHVTLVRKARESRALPSLPTTSWPVSEMLLMQSQLARAGSTYEISARFPLS
jgi:2'-5' RNA ligase